MEFKIEIENTLGNHLFIINDEKTLSELPNISPAEAEFAKSSFEKEHTIATINQYNQFVIIYLLKEKKNAWETYETCRKAGAEIQAVCNKYKFTTIKITNLSTEHKAALLVAEGIALANYQFLKYRSDSAKLAYSLNTICFSNNTATETEVEQLSVMTDAIYKMRTLVNEPVNFLTAEQLSEEIEMMGKDSGFKTTVLNKSKIEKEKMGGLLAVNKGSIDPPTFTIMEHKPKKPINKKPIVLVGKGIVFDTGGLSLKPTLASMDRMKSDMSGAALVSSAMYAISKLDLPLHVIALVPATDNRPGENAYAPGDVITMYSGKTVEVLNTDAEGRMVLADALHYAKKYDPELVVDFATLTGAAAAAIGEHGIVCMGTADAKIKNEFTESGLRQYERLIEFPLWNEFGEQIKSDIADIKNVGGATGGAITAGKFLEHFIDYPWMHFDIAGVSLSTAKKSYIPAGGTAYGLRMLIDFLMNYQND